FALALQASLPTLSLSEAETHSSRGAFKTYRWWAAGAIAVLLAAVLAMLLPLYFSQPDELVAQPTAIPSTAVPSTFTPAPAPAADDAVSTPLQATPQPDSDTPRVWGPTSDDWRHWHFVEVPFAPLDPEVRWVYEPESGGHNQLLAADGLIVLNTGDGIAQALDWNSGEVVWETRLGVEMSLPPGIYADDETAVVILPTVDGALYALGLSDARLMWRIDPESLDGVIQSIYISSDDNIIALTDTGQLYLIQPLSGEIYGALSLGEDYASAYPATLSDTAVFFAAESRKVYALEIVTESIAWESDLNGYPAAPPLGDGGWGYVVAGTEAGWVHAFSSLTGKTVWKFQLDGPIAGLAADWGKIYALTGNGVLYAWDAWEQKLLWKVELDVSVTAGPVTNGDYILLATEEGEILTLSAESGEIQPERTLSTDDPVFSLMPTGNWLFARSDNAIYAFASDE
ncbi:MAG TPA: hypothetical protein ENK24_01320, partial [Anaerolineae bacterium]|nr:hypothetical protein [Anaerolineae bacterium]